MNFAFFILSCLGLETSVIQHGVLLARKHQRLMGIFEMGYEKPYLRVTVAGKSILAERYRKDGSICDPDP